MSASVMVPRGFAGESAKVQATSPSTRQRSIRGDASSDGYSAWLLEDIDAPEAWTLASFDDLVPRESV